MDLFLKLCLAHLIGDFILQFEELYRLKVRSRLGHFLHAAVHAATSLAVTLPYGLDFSLWLFIAAISTVHYFQDQIKYRLQKGKRVSFPYFFMDQILHFLFIGAIFFFSVSRRAASHFGGFPLKDFYADPFYTLCLMAFITAAFAGGYFLHALRKSYFARTRPDHFITSMEMTHGVVERGSVAMVFLFSSHPLFGFASLAVGLLRLPFAKLRNRTDFLLNFVFAAAVGLLFRRLVEIL